MARLPCPPSIAFYTYFQLERAVFPHFARGPADSAQRDSDLLRTAPIVILEENEERAFRSPHGEQLWALIAPHIADPP
ncbi:MAG: hypothetical protein WDN49_25105 [Acetobacteraceae bacterium]